MDERQPLNWTDDGQGHYVASIDETRKARIDLNPATGSFTARRTGDDPGGSILGTCPTLDEAKSLFTTFGRRNFEARTYDQRAQYTREPEPRPFVAAPTPEEQARADKAAQIVEKKNTDADKKSGRIPPGAAAVAVPTKKPQVEGHATLAGNTGFKPLPAGSDTAKLSEPIDKTMPADPNKPRRSRPPSFNGASVVVAMDAPLFPSRRRACPPVLGA